MKPAISVLKRRTKTGAQEEREQERPYLSPISASPCSELKHLGKSNPGKASPECQALSPYLSPPASPSCARHAARPRAPRAPVRDGQAHQITQRVSISLLSLPFSPLTTFHPRLGRQDLRPKHSWGMTLVALTRWQDQGWTQVALGQKSSPQRRNVAAGDAVGHSSCSTPRDTGLTPPLPCCSGWHRSELPSMSPSPQLTLRSLLLFTPCFISTASEQSTIRSILAIKKAGRAHPQHCSSTSTSPGHLHPLILITLPAHFNN